MIPTFRHSASLHLSIAQRFLLGLLFAFCALAISSQARAADGVVDAIAVRFSDAAVPEGTAALPAHLEQSLRNNLSVPFVVVGKTKDGAFLIKFGEGVDLDAARAALNAIRLDPTIVYANVAPGAPTPALGGAPTNRLIVKYKDPTQVALARGGFPLDGARVSQVMAAAGTPVAWMRGTHDGANVMRMLQRMPIGEVEAIAERIAANPEVDYAVPDYIRTAQLTPTDPCYATASVSACNGGYQWDLFDPNGGINMPGAWDITTGSASIRSAVLDTGALPNHPDLAGRYVGGYDMVADCAVGNDNVPTTCTWSSQTPAMTSRDSDAQDPGDWITSNESAGFGSAAPPYNWFQGCFVGNSSFHGTHVAGTIGAVPNNGIGVAGINWVSQIVPVRVLGKCGGYDSDINDAMVWAAGGSVSGIPANANPARVINLSLGGSGSCDAATQNAVNAALALGTVVVVSAGNSNANAANYSPSSCSGVITVAANTIAGLRARYSNYGTSVEITAPGGNAVSGQLDILSTLNSGITAPTGTGYNYVQYAGTSMAAPHVTGVVSLMFSANASLTPAQVLSKIQTTARVFPTPGPACAATPGNVACNCTTALCGAGILNAAAAVASAAGGGPVATTTTLASNLNPSTQGASVTFTATVVGTNPTGTVNFKDGGNSVTGCSAISLAGSGNSRTAQCTTSTLTVTTHSMTATYSGDAGNQTSTSVALSQVVNAPSGPGPTTTMLASSLNPSSVGQTVTFTASISGNSPTGTVDFKDGGVSIVGCSAQAVVLGGGFGGSRTATCATSALTQGTHSVTAVYGGDAGNLTSTSSALSQVVNVGGLPATTTTLASSLNPSNVGQTVTFTATITGGSSPTGTVDFKDGGVSIVGCSAQPVAVGGGFGGTRTATCATNALTGGTHSITAAYSGNAGNAPSTSSALSQGVNGGGPAPTTTTLGSSLNPSTVGAAVTFTATVNGTNPTGTANFKDGASSIVGCAAATVTGAGNSRTATCTTSALTQGTHSVTAVYSGDAGNLTSTSAALSQGVNAAGGPVATTTTIGSSLNPSMAGKPVTFTATVNGSNPTGTVNFKDGASSITGCAAATVTGAGNSRTATCTTSALAQGTHGITAVYGGDAANLTSTSSVLSQVVNACTGRGC